MKNLVYISVLLLSITFFSCEKEKIEIVNNSEETIDIVTRTGAADDGSGDGSSAGCGGVTDPDEDEDYDITTLKKNNNNGNSGK